MTNRTVLISAGHSDTDPGACSGKFKEADLARELRDRIAAHLRNWDVSFLKDGADGINDPLSRAIGLARLCNGVAVEIHFNAASPSATGIEALSKPEHKQFAQDLCAPIHRITGLSLRGDKGWKADNSGQHHRLGFCDAGGVILEICFISNKSDMAVYNTKKDLIARALAEVLRIRAIIREDLTAA